MKFVTYNILTMTIVTKVFTRNNIVTNTAKTKKIFCRENWKYQGMSHQGICLINHHECQDGATMVLLREFYHQYPGLETSSEAHSFAHIDSLFTNIQKEGDIFFNSICRWSDRLLPKSRLSLLFPSISRFLLFQAHLCFHL